MDKQCKRCGEVKGLDDYHRCNKVKDGRVSQCKVCMNARSNAFWASPEGKAYRAARKGSPQQKAAARRHYQKNRDKILAKNKTPEARAAAYVKLKKWRKANKIKTIAHNAVRYRVRVGDMAHPSTLSCSGCGVQASEYHHPDYAQPLAVVPMCKACHEQEHI